MRPLLAGAAVLVGVGTALRTSVRVGRVERAWADDTTGVRWRLVEAAGARLDGELAGAVALARDLANAGVAATELDRAQAFDRLDQVVRPRTRAWRRRLRERASMGLEWPPPNAGVPCGRAGGPHHTFLRHAFRRTPGRRRPAGGRARAVGPDSVVPDRQGALDARFARATGVGLQIYPPGGGPFLADVFDYCVPSCWATDVVPDTLFSVRLAPPSHGAYRLGLLTGGTAGVAGATLALLIGLVAPARSCGISQWRRRSRSGEGPYAWNGRRKM